MSNLKIKEEEYKKYILVRWPESQELMEQPWFNECLFVNNIQGHIDVGDSTYMVPQSRYKELYKIKSNEVEPPSFEESMGEKQK